MEPPTIQTPQPEKTQKIRRRRGAFLRFMRGYLMLVGAATTVYLLLTRLLIPLLIEAQKWIAPYPAV